MGRLIIDKNDDDLVDDPEVGILLNGYKIGEPITVDPGNEVTFTIYNGLEAGHVAFRLSLSEARVLLSATLAIALSMIAVA